MSFSVLCKSEDGFIKENISSTSWVSLNLFTGCDKTMSKTEKKIFDFKIAFFSTKSTVAI